MKTGELIFYKNVGNSIGINNRFVYEYLNGMLV